MDIYEIENGLLKAQEEIKTLKIRVTNVENAMWPEVKPPTD
jgi:hypothetical protein